MTGWSRIIGMTLEDIPWSLGEGNVEGHPLWIRWRQMPDDFPRGRYPERLNIFWAGAAADENGYPEGNSRQQMEAFEERLTEAVEADQQSILAAVLTRGGDREFIYQTGDPGEFIRRLTAMPQESDPYPIEIHRNADATWDYVADAIPSE
jgi:hypothetical protein